MTKVTRIFVVCEGIAFAAAALTHLGVLVRGYEHQQAGIAESVIATVLFVGLMLTFIFDRATRGIGLVVQGFALLGTLVGIGTIAIGIGPRTIPDITYHIAMVVVLVWGLVTMLRARQ